MCMGNGQKIGKAFVMSKMAYEDGRKDVGCSGLLSARARARVVMLNIEKRRHCAGPEGGQSNFVIAWRKQSMS
jgi:hypothetical protein